MVLQIYTEFGRSTVGEQHSIALYLGQGAENTDVYICIYCVLFMCTVFDVILVLVLLKMIMN